MSINMLATSGAGFLLTSEIVRAEIGRDALPKVFCKTGYPQVWRALHNRRIEI